MKSNFKFICPIKENEKVTNVYWDKRRNCYVAMNKDVVTDLKTFPAISIINVQINYLNEKINYLHEKIRKERQRKIINLKVGFEIFLLVILASTAKCKIDEFLEESNKEKLDYLDSERGIENNLLLINSCIDKNQTISSSLREELKQYMDLFVQYDSGMSIVRVASRIKHIDFSKEESISLRLLEEIFDCKNGKFIARQLYRGQQNSFFRSDFYEGLLINYLSFQEEELEKVLCGEDLKFEIDGKKYLVCLDKLNSYYPEVYDYLLEFRNEKIKEIHLTEDYRLGTNVFSSIVEAYSIKGKCSYYYKKENNRLVLCTDEFYIDELTKIINEHGVHFDYYDEKSRQLLYFYIDAYKRNKDFDSFIDCQDISSYIYRTIKEVDVSDLTIWNHYFSYEELLYFIKKGSFSYKHVDTMWDLAIYPEAVGLLQELNLCLKIEVLEGNITKSEYEKFIKKVELVLKYYPEEYEKFQEANEENDSLEGVRLGLIFEPKNNTD